MNKKERFKMNAYVTMILRKDDKILLIKRSKTGVADGYYACAGGGIDGEEPAKNAMVREAREELGITVRKENLKMVHIVHNKQALLVGNESIGFFMEATKWDGDPQNMEPHKHDDVAWFTLNNLPQNTIPILKHVLKMLDENIFYSEFGWE